MVKIRDRESGNVVDRRGRVSTAQGAAVGGLGMLALRFLFSKMGRRFLIPAVVLVAAGWFLAPDLVRPFVMSLFGGGGGASQTVELSPEQRAQIERDQAKYSGFLNRVLATTEDVWSKIFQEAGLGQYPQPQMIYYTQGTPTGCGFGQAAAGPFYCPIADPETGRKALYIDLSFFPLMESKMRAEGDMAQAYVIAHEVGHHVQQTLGVLDWSMQEKQRAGSAEAQNQIQVRIELMADCFAGVWANRAEAGGMIAFERGDIEEAITAAHAVGDDTLMKSAGRRVATESFTHGSAEQRIRWFRKGLETGDTEACDTKDLAYNRL